MKIIISKNKTTISIEFRINDNIWEYFFRYCYSKLRNSVLIYYIGGKTIVIPNHARLKNININK